MFYPREKLPEKLRTPQGYSEVVKSIEDFEDYIYYFNNIVIKCQDSLTTNQLCIALDELAQRTCYNLYEKSNFHLMNIINQHLTNFYKIRLCQLASINDFNREAEDFSDQIWVHSYKS